MNVIYVGPSPSVQITGGYYAVRGEAFEVPDDLGEQLLEQDIYKPAPKKAEKKFPAVPAAPETSEEG